MDCFRNLFHLHSTEHPIDLQQSKQPFVCSWHCIVISTIDEWTCEKDPVRQDINTRGLKLDILQCKFTSKFDSFSKTC